jgi:5S rRNA maturation endonuclease (ribonuclease M5)
MDLKLRILDKTNQGLDVFRHYLSVKFVPNKAFKNPFYHDTKASCTVYMNKKNGLFMMKDFGDAAYSGDCFWLVARLFNLDMKNDFVEILKRINADMNLGLSVEADHHSSVLSWHSQTTASTKSIQNTESDTYSPSLDGAESSMDDPNDNPEVKVTYKEFSDTELEYWGRYGISSSILSRFKVRSGKKIAGKVKNGRKYEIHSMVTSPMFVYHTIDDAVKVYMPFNKMRFLYAHPACGDYVFGLEYLPSRGHMIFITGGEKDVMSLAAHGFQAVCFNSETANIPRDILVNLHRRFKHIVLLYDMDKTGQQSSRRLVQELSEFKVKRIDLPLSGSKGDKDISDFFANGHTAAELDKIVGAMIHKIYKKKSVLLKTCEIDFANPPTPSPTVFEVNGVPLGTCDNLFCLTGGEGVGKSNFVAAIISGSLVNNELDTVRTLGLTVIPNPTKKAVLLFDTEQSGPQLYKNMEKALRRCYLTEPPSHFHAYHLQTQSKDERLDMIRTALDLHYHEHKGVKLVVIDGIADLVRSANDEIESIEVIDELYSLAGFYHCCFLCVLHFVPNGMKLRGHLGSELQRKAAGIVSLERDDNQEFSVIKAMKVRDGSPLEVPHMLIGWDKDEEMFVFKGVKSGVGKTDQKYNELKGIARKLFRNAHSLMYTDMVRQIMDMMDVKERTAKDYVRYMRDKAIIEKSDGSNYQIKLF